MKFHPDIAAKIACDIPESAADATAFIALAVALNSKEDCAEALNKAAARFRLAAEDCFAVRYSICPPEPVPPRPQATQPARLPVPDRESNLKFAGDKMAKFLKNSLSGNAPGALEALEAWEKAVQSLKP